MRAIALLALAAAAAVSIGLAVAVGSADTGLGDLLPLGGAADPAARVILLELRLPRALSAFATGAALALAGVYMQVLLRNPLADPYVLGVSGGAAAAALTAMLAGAAGLAVSAAAAGGALAAMLTVFALAHGRGGWTPARLLLTGVVVAAGCNAVVSLMLALADEALAAGVLLARPLDVLARGELQASLLGLPVRGTRAALYVVGSLLTAAAVTTAGSIGFVGLVTPHLVRLALGSSHRIVVPASALAGGTLVVLADLAARTVAAPRQLPVGALTALVGVPAFLLLMRRQRSVA